MQYLIFLQTKMPDVSVQTDTNTDSAVSQDVETLTLLQTEYDWKQIEYLLTSIYCVDLYKMHQILP